MTQECYCGRCEKLSAHLKELLLILNNLEFSIVRTASGYGIITEMDRWYTDCEKAKKLIQGALEI